MSYNLSMAVNGWAIVSHDLFIVVDDCVVTLIVADDCVIM